MLSIINYLHSFWKIESQEVRRQLEQNNSFYYFEI